VNNFDRVINEILESIGQGSMPDVSGNLAGSGGSLGNFQTSGWVNNPDGTPGTDKFATGDSRRPFALGARKKRKIKFQRRPLLRGGL